MEVTKSPSTGYTVTDYVQKVFEHLHMSNAGFARRVGIEAPHTLQWRKGSAEPTMRYLRRLEEISGVMIRDYLPEVERGWALLTNAQEWQTGFVHMRMHTWGVQISNKRCADARNGIIKDGKLFAKQLIQLNGYYEWWCAEEKRKKAERAEKEKRRLENLVRMAQAQEQYDGYRKKLLARRESIANASGEEDDALNLYYKVMGTSGTGEFNLHRVEPGLWACETRHYRVEFDLGAEELRVIWRQSGELSFRRDFRAIA